MQLKYVGDRRYVVGVGGWPASDHDEPNKTVAKSKIKSGLYTGPTDAAQARQEKQATKERKDAVNVKAKQRSDARINDAEATATEAQEALADTRRAEGREA